MPTSSSIQRAVFAALNDMAPQLFAQGVNQLAFTQPANRIVKPVIILANRAGLLRPANIYFH